MLGNCKEIGTCNRSVTCHDSVRKKAVYSWFSKSSGSVPEPFSSLSNAEPILTQGSARGPPQPIGRSGEPGSERAAACGASGLRGFRLLSQHPDPGSLPRAPLPRARSAGWPVRTRPAVSATLDSRPSAGPAITHGLILRIRREHRSPEVQLAAATTNHADALFLHHLRARAGTLYRRLHRELPQRKPVGR